nr:hypothetical protein [Tanacetum cinerariifolium]
GEQFLHVAHGVISKALKEVVEFFWAGGIALGRFCNDGPGGIAAALSGGEYRH